MQVDKSSPLKEGVQVCKTSPLKEKQVKLNKINYYFGPKTSKATEARTRANLEPDNNQGNQKVENPKE